MFTAALAGLWDRLEFRSDSDGFVTRRMLEEMLSRMGADIFSTDAGLDSSRPIECAGRSSGAFVCTAYVHHPGHVREHLSKRALGADTGLAIPLKSATGVMALPLVFAASPVVAHSMLYAEHEKRRGSARLVSERVRTTEKIAGFTLDRFATVDVREHYGAIVDHEHYLVIEDKLFVFAGRELIDLVLEDLPTPGSALSDVAGVERALQRWARGANLSTVVVEEGANGHEVTRAHAVALTSRGATFDWMLGNARSSRNDVSSLVRQLATGAATALAVDLSAYAADGDAGIPDLPKSPESAGIVPPMKLLESAGIFALAWYPHTSGPLWKDWLLAVPWDAQTQDWLDKSGWKQPSGTSELTKGIFGVHRGKNLVLSTSLDLLSRSDRETMPEGKGLRLWTHFDSNRVAERLSSLVSESERPDGSTWGLRVFSQLAALATEASAHGRQRSDSTTQQLQGSISLRTRPKRVGSVDPVVDQWLSVKNSLALPAQLDAAATRKPVTFVFSVNDAQRFARLAFAKVPKRMQVSVRNSREVEVRVSPTGREDDESARSALAPTGSERIKTLAKRIVGDSELSEEDIAEKVLRWVSTSLAYEVTPQRLGLQEVLSRGRGDCSEYSLLTVSLLRAVGIRAVIREGLLASGDTMVAHAWVAYSDGSRWIEIDPTNNSMSVGSGHVVASVTDVVGAIAVENLEVARIELH